MDNLAHYNLDYKKHTADINYIQIYLITLHLIKFSRNISGSVKRIWTHKIKALHFFIGQLLRKLLKESLKLIV